MTDEEPPRRISSRISPLAIIIGIALIVMVAIAFVGARGHHTTASGVNVPMAGNYPNEVMPKQSTVSNTPAPTSNANDAVEAQPTAGNEVGGLTAHSGPANTAQ